MYIIGMVKTVGGKVASGLGRSAGRQDRQSVVPWGNAVQSSKYSLTRAKVENKFEEKVTFIRIIFEFQRLFIIYIDFMRK